jgi:hypothetical protein
MIWGGQGAAIPAPRLIIPHDSDGTLPDLAAYHISSRVVHRQYLFQMEEKFRYARHISPPAYSPPSE